MYGLVNKAIRDLICTQHGAEMWTQVREHAGIAQDQFVSMERYPDSMTYDLVASASEKLGASPEDLLKAFGEYWVLFTAQEGFGELFDFAGSDMTSFLGNLDEMHARISLTLPDLEPPSFDLLKLEGGQLALHYYSDRAGLAPMVVGLIEGLATRFGATVEIEHVAAGDDQEYECFLLRVDEAEQADVA